MNIGFLSTDSLLKKKDFSRYRKFWILIFMIYVPEEAEKHIFSFSVLSRKLNSEFWRYMFLTLAGRLQHHALGLFMSSFFINTGSYFYTAVFQSSLPFFEQEVTFLNVFPVFNFKISMTSWLVLNDTHFRYILTALQLQNFVNPDGK